jgi:hypothetical protein
MASPSSERAASASITLSPLSSASGGSIRATDVVGQESDNKNASGRLAALLRAGAYDAAISGIWKSAGVASCSWSVFILPAVWGIAEGSKDALRVAKTTAVVKSVSGGSFVLSAASGELGRQEKNAAILVKKKEHRGLEDRGLIESVNNMMSQLKNLSEAKTKIDLQRFEAAARELPGAGEFPDFLLAVEKIVNLVTQSLQSSEKSNEGEIKAIRDAYEKRISDLRSQLERLTKTQTVPLAKVVRSSASVVGKGSAKANDSDGEDAAPSPVQLSPHHSPETSKNGRRASVSQHHSHSISANAAGADD